MLNLSVITVGLLTDIWSEDRYVVGRPVCGPTTEVRSGDRTEPKNGSEIPKKAGPNRGLNDRSNWPVN